MRERARESAREGGREGRERQKRSPISSRCLPKTNVHTFALPWSHIQGIA